MQIHTHQVMISSTAKYYFQETPPCTAATPMRMLPIGILSLLPFLWTLLPGQQFDRVWVLSLGCFIWGTMACAFAFSNTVLQGMFFWAFNGGQCVRHWQRWRRCAAPQMLSTFTRVPRPIGFRP
jgi:hypothetical protein